MAEHFSPQEKTNHKPLEIHRNSSMCQTPEQKIQGDISIGKDLARPLLENSKSIKPSLSYRFILSVENILKFITARKATTSRVIQGSFLSCEAVPCCNGWSDCWDQIQILLKSKGGSLHKPICTRLRLGGGESFLSTTDHKHKKIL